MAHLASIKRSQRRGVSSFVLATLLLSGCTIHTTTYETTPKNEQQPTPEPVAEKPKPAPEKPAPEPEKPAEPVAEKPKPKPPAPKPDPKPVAEKPKPQPDKPAEVVDRPDVVPPGKLAEKPAPKPVVPKPPSDQTHIVLPVKVSLAALSQQIDAVVPKKESRDWTQVTDEGDSPRAEIKADIWRDQPIDVSFSDGTFHITVPVRYAANVRAWVQNPLKKSDWISIAKNESWGTRQEPQELRATFHAKVGIDDNWKVTSELKLGELKHGAPPSGKICKNVGVDVCVERETIAPRVNREIDAYLRPKLEKALAKVDAQVEKALKLEQRAGKVWKSLQTPQAVKPPASKQPLWLVMLPSAVGVRGPVLDGKDVRVDLAIEGKIAVVPNKPAVKPAALPKLTELKQPAGFSVIAQLQLPPKTLGASLERELSGLQLGKEGESLSVEGAEVLAKADPKQPHRIALQLQLGGDVKDRVTLSGELAYDAASQTLRVQGLDVSAQDAELRKKLGDARLAQLLEQIERKARWDLRAEAAPLQKAVSKALGQSLRGEVQVSGSLDQLHVHEFAFTSEGLSATVLLGGQLQIAYAAK